MLEECRPTTIKEYRKKMHASLPFVTSFTWKKEKKIGLYTEQEVLFVKGLSALTFIHLEIKSNRKQEGIWEGTKMGEVSVKKDRKWGLEWDSLPPSSTDIVTDEGTAYPLIKL